MNKCTRGTGSSHSDYCWIVFLFANMSAQNTSGKAPSKTFRKRHSPYHGGKGKVVPKSRGTQADHEEKVKVHHRSHGKQLGQVLVLGQGLFGQLGLGDDIKQRKKPALVPLPEGIVQVAAGGVHTVCLGASGSVYTFGCNDEGSLGRHIEEEEDSFLPGEVGHMGSLA